MYHDLMGQDGIIGVFDSGVGGISVLNHLVKLMPHERFVFYMQHRDERRRRDLARGT